MANAPERMSDEDYHLLMHQLMEQLGGDLLATISSHIYQIRQCPPGPGGESCICAALYAYGVLYEAGLAIVPIEDARQLAVMRGRVN